MRIEFEFKKLGKEWQLWSIDGFTYYSSRTKAENKFLKEFHKWLEGATEFRLIAEKEVKDGTTAKPKV